MALEKITLLLLDCDGVLTDGTIYFDSQGFELKAFHTHDGAGLKYLQRAGLKAAILSGRDSAPVEARARELGIEAFQGEKDKAAAYERIKAHFGVTDEQVCYVADDLTDIPVLRRAGYAVAVPDARPEVKQLAHYVTTAAGGRGAVREVVELILKAQGKWAGVIKRYGL